MKLALVIVCGSQTSETRDFGLKRIKVWTSQPRGKDKMSPPGGKKANVFPGREKMGLPFGSTGGNPHQGEQFCWGKRLKKRG